MDSPGNTAYEHDLRRHTRVLLKYGFLALAGAGALVCMHLLAQLESEVIGYAASMRGVLGFSVAPPGAPDVYLLVTAAILPVTLVSACTAVFLTWRGSVSRRVMSRWRTPSMLGGTQDTLSRARIRRNSRIMHVHARCPDPGRCPACCARTRYLGDLLSLSHWDTRSDPVLPAGSLPPTGLLQLPSSPVAPPSYETLATATFQRLGQDIATRALATGLAVGFSHNRLLDGLTVVAATFETHLFVLCELGKRPTLPVTLRIARNAAAALFVNLFLNREDVISLNVIIRKVAFGIEGMAAGTEELTHHLSEPDLDLDDLDMGSGWLKAATTFATFGLTVGATGLRAIGAFIDRFGSDLVQGCIAAGILWHQAGSFAADILARDERHRQQLLAEVTPSQCAARMAERAGRILQSQVRELRAALREKRKALRKHYLKF